ncbi:hypothetical protein FRC07_012588 [Ceratobasidium sp. 392]|nr:hypothetical protein FRC07_012588 [Ceratobasidium sp. 392]
MSIKPGRYFIQSVADSSHFVGTGPVPPIYPPFPAPLRSVGGFIRDVFEVKSDGGDKYTLKTHDLWVGFDEDNNVRLVQAGGKSVTWAVDRANGPGLFRFKLPDSDKYWTASNDDDYAPIRLEGANGSPLQEWRFVPYDE